MKSTFQVHAGLDGVFVVRGVGVVECFAEPGCGHRGHEIRLWFFLFLLWDTGKGK